MRLTPALIIVLGVTETFCSGGTALGFLAGAMIISLGLVTDWLLRWRRGRELRQMRTQPGLDGRHREHSRDARRDGD